MARQNFGTAPVELIGLFFLSCCGLLMLVLLGMTTASGTLVSRLGRRSGSRLRAPVHVWVSGTPYGREDVGLRAALMAKRNGPNGCRRYCWWQRNLRQNYVSFVL